MKSKLAAAAAIVALGFSTSANAVILSFQLSGYVDQAWRFDQNGVATSDPFFVGQSVFATINMDTDALQRYEYVTSDASHLTLFEDERGPDTTQTSLLIGGVSYEIGGHAFNSGAINYLDTRRSPACVVCFSDQFSISDTSYDDGFAPGDYGFRGLHVISAAPYDRLNPSAGLDYIDLTQPLDALSVLSLPLASLIGGYGEGVMTCDADFTCAHRQQLSLSFAGMSLTRTIQSVSVPEPGALALFGLGLAGLVATRRRTSSDTGSTAAA